MNQTTRYLLNSYMYTGAATSIFSFCSFYRETNPHSTVGHFINISASIGFSAIASAAWPIYWISVILS